MKAEGPADIRLRAREVFLEALDYPEASARDAFLAEACGVDAILRRRVESMLSEHFVEDGFMQGPATGEALSADPDRAVGTTVGRYHLLQQIGEGGMGLVYLAEQQEPVRRRVALKILKPGLDTRQIVARFEAERQALALMDHPNIAKVLDGGATEESNGRTGETANRRASDSPLRPVADSPVRTPAGRPYFVMELIQGVPITEFCEKQRLSLEQRLRLFIQVCQGVQHAHQKGIIHRDLKPSNVMVTVQDRAPVPKVIDFGVAKAINQQLTEKTIFTQHTTLIGTPAYMSPEQAERSGLDVDTRSDIYSLGVLLYELLTGTQPFPEQRLRSVAFAEMQRILLDEQPERPSARLTRALALESPPGSRAVFGGPPKTPSRQSPAGTGEEAGRASGEPPEAAREPRALPKKGPEPACGPRARPGELRTAVQALRGDLDWIVLKCLEKDRNRRYETANGLAADLARFLADEPVVARPPSAVYRFQKLVRRHRGASLAAGLVTLVVVLGGVVSTWALLQERTARWRERTALEQAHTRLVAALGFVDQVLTNVAPEIRLVPAATKAQDNLLRAGLDFVRRLRESAGEDPVARVTLARWHIYMSARQNPGEPNTTGDYAEGLKHAEEALQLLAAPTPQLTDAERLDLSCQARFALIPCLYGMARWEEGVTRSKELAPLLEALERSPAGVRWDPKSRMMLLQNAGWANFVLGRADEALECALSVLRSDWARTITNNLETAGWEEIHYVMNAHDVAGNVCGLLLKNFEAMRPHADETVRIGELLERRFPENVHFVYLTAQARAWQGYALMCTGHVGAGKTALDHARQELESRAEKEATSDAFRRNRMIIAALQALAFAGWSEDPSASFVERHQRLAQAEGYLADAEAFAQTTKAAPSRTMLTARTEIPEARAKLEVEERAQAKP